MAAGARAVLVLNADHANGAVIARAYANQGWPVALQFSGGRTAVSAVVEQVWNGGGVVRAVDADPVRATALMRRIERRLGFCCRIVDAAEFLVPDPSWMIQPQLLTTR